MELCLQFVDFRKFDFFLFSWGNSICFRVFIGLIVVVCMRVYCFRFYWRDGYEASFFVVLVERISSFVQCGFGGILGFIYISNLEQFLNINVSDIFSILYILWTFFLIQCMFLLVGFIRFFDI